MMFIWYVCYWLTWAPRRWLRRSAGVLIRWRRGQVKQDQDPNTGMDLATATVTAMDNNWDLQLSPWCQGGTFAEASSSVKTASDWNRWKKLEEDGRRRNPQDLKDCSAMLSLNFIFLGLCDAVGAVHRLQRIMDPARARGQCTSFRRGSKQTAPTGPTGSPGLEMLQVSTGTTPGIWRANMAIPWLVIHKLYHIFYNIMRIKHYYKWLCMTYEYVHIIV